MPNILDEPTVKWSLDALHIIDTHAFKADSPAPGTQSFSVGFWCQTALWQGYRILVNQGDMGDGEAGWSCLLDGTRLVLRLTFADGATAECAAPLDASAEWRHVAATVDRVAGSVRLYVDGAPVADSAIDNAASLGEQTRVTIGGYTDPAGGHFDHTFGRNGTGWIDDVRLYSRVLTDAEIRSYVSRDGEPPIAAFTLYTASDVAPTDLRFEAQGAARAWLWDFGDGTRGYGRQVVHRYLYAGEYSVRLTVVDAAHRSASVEQMLTLGGQTNPLTFTPVFVNGTEGYACYRIPSIVRAVNGDLVAFAEGRVESCSDSTSTIRAVCKRSSDNGLTWSAVQVVARNLIGGEEHAVANISPVVEENTGRIVVLFNKAEVSEWLLAKGQGRSRICRVFSDDHGVTWQGEADISAQVQRSADDWRVQRPTLGHAIQLRHPNRRGRLLHAGLFTQGERSVFQSQNYVFWSDDRGETWQIGGVIPCEGLNEATVVELENGDILVNSRAYRDERSEGVRAVTRGHFDGDRLIFDETRLDAALVEPAVQASILRYSWADEDRSRILFSNPAHPHARINLTVRLSYDDGLTWPVARVVDAGPSAYSDLVVQQDGAIGVLYERGNQGGIHYVHFTLDWLTGDTHE